jgi:hypothetical protein
MARVACALKGTCPSTPRSTADRPLGDAAMKSLSERVTDHLRERICQVCIYQTAGGGCSLTKDLACPILTRVDLIIEVVRQIDDDRIDPYVDKLRDTICVDCRMQDAEGKCLMRDAADCALDDYFPLIVEIVEEELERE